MVKIRLIFLLFLCAVFSCHSGNLVPNSSFELGSGRGWMYWKQKDNAGTPLALKSQIVGSAAHGNKCARLTAEYSLITRAMWLTNGTTYKLTFSAKSSPGPDTFVVEFATWGTINNVPGGAVQSSIVPPTTWTRYTNTYTPTLTTWHMVRFFHIQSALTVDVDAIQFESTTPTSYMPMSAVEAGLESSAHRNALFAEDAKSVSLIFWNESTTATIVTSYEIFDLWNRRTAGLITNVLPTGFTTTNISLAYTGLNRVVTRVASINDSRDELTLSVLPIAARAGVNTNSILGTHSNYEANQITNLRQTGFAWTRAFSPAISLFRWRNVELSSNSFSWQDAGVNVMASNGLAVLGVLADNDGAAGPAWSTDGSYINLIAYSNFCYNAANRYAGKVDYWEAWNEPAQSGVAWVQNTNNYAALLSVFAKAIKAGNPNAKVVAMAGVFDEEWALRVWGLLSAEDKALVDIVSCHLYPNDNSSDPNEVEFDIRHFEWRAAFGGIRPIWNTESGSWSRGGLQTENGPIWSFVLSGGTEWSRGDEMRRGLVVSVDRVTRNLIRSLGNNFRNYFYYDTRFPTEEMITSTHPTGLDLGGSYRPQAIALQTASSLFGNCSSGTQVVNVNEPNGFLEMYQFTTGTTNVIAAFNYDRVARRLGVTNTSFTVYDVMGNTVTMSGGTNLIVTRTPQYIWSDTLTAGQLSATIANAPVYSQSDTNAPSVSIDVAPSGTWSGGVAFVKWTGVDDTYFNSSTFPTNVDYSWKLDDANWSQWGQTNHLWADIPAATNLYVRARDKDGNTSTNTYVFSGYAPEAPASPPPRNLRKMLVW